MKNETWSFLLSIFSAIWICKPIPYETLSYPIYKGEETIWKVLAVDPGESQGEILNNKKRIDLSFHRRLEQYFPDWDRRIAYQQRQEKFYKSAMIKKREIQRLRILETPNIYNKEELDAISYFQGTGFYRKYQDPKVKPNIFDTRQSFLVKMHDYKLRNEFLDSFNRRNN